MMTTTDAERLVYDWCTHQGRGSPAAQTLALVYATTYWDKAHLLTLSPLRQLSEPHREWALALLKGYIAGWFTAPRGRVLELMEHYDIRSDVDEDG